MECPYCGGTLNIESGLSSCFCNYCGKQIFINDGVHRVEISKTETIHYIDDVKLREIELRELRRIKEEERLKKEAEEHRQALLEAEKEEKIKIKKWWWLVGGFYFLLIILIAVSILIKGDGSGFFMLAFCFWMLAPLYLSSHWPKLHKFENEKKKMILIYLELLSFPFAVLILVAMVSNVFA